MIRLLICGIAALVIAGCTPSMLLSQLNAFEGVVEVEVDAAIDEIENRRCKLPIDILERTSNRRGQAWLEGWMSSCPAAARLFRAVPEGGSIEP